jgi:alkylation response protein AidB-like acyl-CoA dehydrogenase
MNSILNERVELSDAVLGLVTAHAAGSDRSGHLDPRVVEALRVSGINRLLLPVELGGVAASPQTCVEIIERLAIADGSTAWAAAIGFGTNHFAGYLDRDGAADVFTDPDAPGAAMFAPLGRVVTGAEGRLRLTGRWPFVSNSEQAAWFGFGAQFDGEPAPRLVFAPRAAVTIHDDTWDVVGMRATGSHDVSLSDFSVDRRHTCAFADRPWPDGQLWRLPLFVVLGPCLAAVSLGIARAALDELTHQALAHRQQMRGQLFDDPIAMADLATADTRLRAARAGLLDALDACWTRAGAGDPVERDQQARTMLATQHSTDVAVDVAGTAHRLGGGAAAYRRSPLLRAVRDLETIRQHVIFSHGLRPHLARALVGTGDPYPPFVI